MRKCKVNGQDGLFHRWGDVSYPIGASVVRGGYPGGQVTFPVAIVEMLPERTVIEARATEITFIDEPDGEESK